MGECELYSQNLIDRSFISSITIEIKVSGLIEAIDHVARLPDFI